MSLQSTFFIISLKYGLSFFEVLRDRVNFWVEYNPTCAGMGIQNTDLKHKYNKQSLEIGYNLLLKCA